MAKLISFLTIAGILSGCGKNAAPQQQHLEPVSDTARTTLEPNQTQTPEIWIVKKRDSGVTFNNAEPPLTFPTDTFLSFERLIEQHARRHKATLIYFDGMQGSGANQLERMHEKGLLNGLTDTLRVVAAEMRDTTRNSQRLWFPWGHHPYQIVPNLNLGARRDMEDSMRVIMPIIEREARLLGGEYSRIYLLGYSQGGMMATWLGLMSNRPLGGVINMHGVFPVFDLDQVSEAGKDVTIYHLHDPLDTKVIYANAEKGLRSAVAAGARGYTTIVDTVVNGEAHHGFSQNVCKVVNAWLHDVFNRSRLK